MNLINEASPHFHGKDSTQKIMGLVCLSLVPTVIAATVLYGLGAPLLVMVCIATALVCEHLCCIAMHRESTAGDMSCVVTAMLFAFTLPANCPFWVAVLGTAFAVVVVKMLFGGHRLQHLQSGGRCARVRDGCAPERPFGLPGRAGQAARRHHGCHAARHGVCGQHALQLSRPAVGQPRRRAGRDLHHHAAHRLRVFAHHARRRRLGHAAVHRHGGHRVAVRRPGRPSTSCFPAVWPWARFSWRRTTPPRP